MSALIINEDRHERIKLFSLPLVEGKVVTAYGELTTGNQPSAEDVAALIEQSTADGYAAGFQQGLAEGKQEVERRIGLLEEVIEQLKSPLEALDEEVLQSITKLVSLVAKQIVRRQLTTDPTGIVDIVRDAVRQLPISDRKITIYINPSDLEIIGGVLNAEGSDTSWALEPDPTLSQGGCIVKTDVSEIDASLEKRISQIVAAMSGDEPANAE